MNGVRCSKPPTEKDKIKNLQFQNSNPDPDFLKFTIHFIRHYKINVHHQ